MTLSQTASILLPYMSNRGTNHQHGLTTMKFTRPKSKDRKRRNKEKARERRLAWQESVSTKAPVVKKPAPRKGAGKAKKAAAAKKPEVVAA